MITRCVTHVAARSSIIRQGIRFAASVCAAVRQTTTFSSLLLTPSLQVPGSNVPVEIPRSDLLDDKSEFLQPIDMENLPRAQKRYAKQIEEINMIRTKEIFRRNYRNILTMIILAGVVASIYVYTCVAVKQETFLEEIDQEMEEEAKLRAEQVNQE